MTNITETPGVGNSRAAELTQDDVLEKASEIADREGLQALSVRRLGSELGVAPMTIYSHVASKEALLELMARRTADRFELPQVASLDWRDQVEAIMVEIRAFLIQNPSLALLLTTRRVVSIGLSRSIEATLAYLTGAGFRLDQAVHSYSALFAYTLGFVTFEKPRTSGKVPDAEEVAEQLQAIAGGGRFPNVERARELLPEMADDESFRLGLRALIVGLSVEVVGEQNFVASTTD